MMQGIFITGTDTDVGKTYITCAIVRACRETGIRVGAYKPVCTGAQTSPAGDPTWSDAELLADALDHRFAVDRICPQRFLAPLAPPVAAAQEGRPVDAALMRQGVEAWSQDADLLLVEGVGGLLCPLTEDCTIADFAADLGFPVVIVASLKLGAINHTLMTIEAARHRQLPVAGVLLNRAAADDGSSDSGIAEITRRSSVPILGVLPFDAEGQLRLPDVIRRIDWQSLSASTSARPIDTSF